jgi:hypothetical protein
MEVCSIPICTVARVFGVAAGKAQGEFVVADAGEYVARGGEISDPAAELDQRLVAAEVAIDFIELLELGEAEQQHAHLVVGVFQRRAQLGLELAAIGKLRQRIAQGDRLGAHFGGQPFRSLVSLVAYPAQAEQHQRHPEEIQERRGLDPDPEQPAEERETAPVNQSHVGDDRDGEHHQCVGDLPRECRGEP